MKLLLVLALCACAAAAPNAEKHQVIVIENTNISIENRNWLVDILVTQLINFIRALIRNGLSVVGIPPLDPLKIDNLHIEIPAGLINLDLELHNAVMVGLGNFVVHKSRLDLSDLTFDIDISVPRLDVSSEIYDLTGDLLTAIPVYGKGNAKFIIEGFRIKALLYLKQSDDGKSVIIDHIEDATFDIPSFKSYITGAIGGGDIDAIVNAVIEEVIVDYIIRFRGAISSIATRAIIAVGNPILELLDTWKYIAPLLPRS